MITPITKLEAAKDYEAVARRWYELINALAPDYIDIDEDNEPIPWEDFPENNRNLLAAVVTALIGEGTIR